MAGSERQSKAKKRQDTTDDKALLEAKPDWDRMGEIADRLLSTPPDRQAVGKAVAQKRPKFGQSGWRGG